MCLVESVKVGDDDINMRIGFSIKIVLRISPRQMYSTNDRLVLISDIVYLKSCALNL